MNEKPAMNKSYKSIGWIRLVEYPVLSAHISLPANSKTKMLLLTFLTKVPVTRWYVLVLEVKQPRPLWEILFSTHHTDIGLLYIVSSITFLMMGGALAMALRAELFYPGAQIIPNSSDFLEYLLCMERTCYFCGFCLSVRVLGII